MAWPAKVSAERPALKVIGILVGGSAESFAPFEQAFRKGMNEGGLPDGSNVPLLNKPIDSAGRKQFKRVTGVGRSPREAICPRIAS